MKQNKRSRATGVQTEQTPRRPLSAAKKVLIVSMCLLATVTGILATAVGYAYFTKEEIYDAYFGASMGELFDHLKDDTVVRKYQETVLGYTKGELVPATAENWGTINNPYVISEGKHLNNLSQLQNIGYFDKHYISKNFQDGTFNKEVKEMPYFLVCTPDGTPVCIEGANEMIKPIGTEEYPFIGSIQGAFVGGTCTVVGDPDDETDNKTSDVSVLHDVNIASTVDSVDVGLFAHISYVGESSEGAGTSFAGHVSEVSNLLLYDVTVTVDKETWFDAIWQKAENHIFAKNRINDGTTSVPDETHHLGIFAGHVTYSRVEMISIYYSEEDDLAIDLSHLYAQGKDTAEANYMSATGIIGFLDGLNPEIGPNGEIKKGSGVSNNGIQLGTTPGTGGGGALSGNERGYVIAKNVLDKFNSSRTETTTDGQISYTYNRFGANEEPYIKNMFNPLTGERLVKEGTLNNWMYGERPSGRYYFYDGVFTFALSANSGDTIGQTWKNDVVQSFTIGPNDHAKWEAPSTLAEESVLAYLKKITSDEEFKTILEDPDSDLAQKLVIVAELPDEEGRDATKNGTPIFMMSLYKASTGVDEGAPEEKFYTEGQKKYYAGSDLLTDLKNKYTNGTLSMNGLTGVTETKAEEFANNLGKADGYMVVKLGEGTNKDEIDRLNDQYRITGATVGSHAYFAEYTNGDMPVSQLSDNLKESIEYTGLPVTVGNKTVYGYFYWESASLWGTKGYKYYWQSLDGSEPVVISDPDDTGYIYNNHATFFNGQNADRKGGTGAILGTSWQGETQYSFKKTNDTVTYQGILIDKNSGKFQSGETIIRQGNRIFKEVNSGKGYFLYDVGDKTCQYLGAGAEIPISSLQASATSAGGGKIYLYNNQQGFLVCRYPQYSFSAKDKNDKTNRLQLLTVQYTVSLGMTATDNILQYLLWNGPEGGPGNDHLGATDYSNPALQRYSSKATVKFNADGSCSISYSDAVNPAARYVTYRTTGGGRFVGSTEEGDVKLSLYYLAGTKAGDAPAGGDTTIYTPTENAQLRSADQYVLLASSAKDSANTTPSNIFRVLDLATADWRDDTGTSLANSLKLRRKFQMSQGINVDSSFSDYWGVTETLGDGLVKAPVGTLGYDAVIPQSCIAFRLNETKEEDQVIRVIVALPTSEVYSGHADDPYADIAACYFAMWHSTEAGWEHTEGGGTTQTFERANYIDRFYMPISRPYAPTSGTTAPENAEHVKIADANGNVTGRTYLSGKQVLVAYEFKMKEAGVYILGGLGYKNDGSTAPIAAQIVYFAADGAASEGNDGQDITGLQLGTIDFVYDNGQKVVPVQETAGAPAGATGNKYDFYYPSYAIFYFDNNLKTADGSSSIKINDAGIRLRRTANTTSENPPNPTITYKRKYNASLGEYIRFNLYAQGIYADTLTQNDAAWVEPAS